MWISASGLMDRADPAVQLALSARLDSATVKHGVTWHQMRHRHLGDGHWVDFHLVFADETTVRDAHEIATEIEREVRDEMGPSTIVTTHLEPAEDHERIHGHPPGESPGDSGRSIIRIDSEKRTDLADSAWNRQGPKTWAG
jgi:divalent metal cation (Fe/Co/Zn/Cd) transporter